jgi:tRNA 2-thiouridine synthesizing protein A
MTLSSAREIGWRQSNAMTLSRRRTVSVILRAVLSWCSQVTVPDQAAEPHFDEEWDAADLACGDLVLRLRFRLRAMQPGHVIRVRALDAGAPVDLPAWCRLTGQTLLHTDTQGKLYYIRREGR